MANCDVCGASMAHFINPDRWICPRTSDHVNIERARRQGGGAGRKNRGQARPKSRIQENLRKKRKG